MPLVFVLRVAFYRFQIGKLMESVRNWFAELIKKSARTLNSSNILRVMFRNYFKTKFLA